MRLRDREDREGQREPILRCEGLSKLYGDGFFRRGNTVHAVADVSLVLWPGETLGLIGESGCGKSTLGRALLRLIEPSAGRVVIDGTCISGLSAPALRAFRQKAQMIFQDPVASLNPRMTIGQILTEPLRIHRMCKSRAAEQERLGELLQSVGLRQDVIGRYPHEFSGGQKQRIGIARALALRPRFLIADEPVSALDVSIQAQIVNLLSDLREQQGLSYLLISHDLKVIAHMCDRVAVMYLGRIIETGPAHTIYEMPIHPYSQALLSTLPQSRSRIVLGGDLPSPSAPPSGCAFHPRCPRYAENGEPAICRTERPLLRIAGKGPVLDVAAHRHDSMVACHFAT